ncbi:MAG: CapA family protein [bacterium]|nr:CapA family protein [bacterium]
MVSILRKLPVIALLLLVVMPVFSPLSAQPTCGETNGRSERTEFRVSEISTTMYFSVYLPPCYDQTGDDYPVIYLMHGSNDDDGQWLRIGLGEVLDARIMAGEIPPIIVVMPGGNWVANENEFGGVNTTWDDIFLRQVMPMAEGQYRIRANRAYRAIGGISRGGFWAYQIAFRNPVLFSAVGGHSAFFDLYHAPDEYNPLDLALNAPNLNRMRIWLDRGRDDYAAPGLDIMGERLVERGLEHTYMIYPEGQHYFTYWAEHIPDYLDFYTAPWREEMLTASEAAPEAAAQSDVEVTPEITSEPALESTPEATSPPIIMEAGEAVYLLVPAVAFPSLQANISSEQLTAISQGQAVPGLVLAEDVVSILNGFGISVAPETEIVPSDALYNTLWRFSEKFTLLPFDQLNTRYRVLNVDELHPVDHDLTTFPFAFESDTPNFDRSRLTRLLLSGVTAITRESIPAIDANGVEWAAEALAPYVQRADFFHISNEVSFDPNCPQMRNDVLGGPTSFCSKREHFEIFNLLDVDIVELSGNHNNDYGYQAYLDTLEWYRDNDIIPLGGGETPAEAQQPLLIEHNGNRVAMIACNWVGPYYALANDDPTLLGGVRPGAADCSQPWLRETLTRLNSEGYLIVVTVQHDEADQYTPVELHRQKFQQLADWGADVVAGTASHFPQIFQFYNESFIHYGLGNLYFDQDFFPGVRFFMDNLYFYDGRLLTVDLFTGLTEGQGRPRPMTPEEREVLLYLIFREHGEF